MKFLLFSFFLLVSASSQAGVKGTVTCYARGDRQAYSKSQYVEIGEQGVHINAWLNAFCVDALEQCISSYGPRGRRPGEYRCAVSLAQVVYKNQVYNYPTYVGKRRWDFPQ